VVVEVTVSLLFVWLVSDFEVLVIEEADSFVEDSFMPSVVLSKLLKDVLELTLLLLLNIFLH
jgi:hypothetical protein